MHKAAKRALDDACAADRLKTTNALLDTRDVAGEHWVVGHQIVAEVAGAGSTEAPHRPTGAKNVINLNRRM
jgi:hypothetical protein